MKKLLMDVFLRKGKPGRGYYSHDRAFLRNGWLAPTAESETQIAFVGKPGPVRLGSGTIAILATPQALVKLIMGLILFGLTLRLLRA